MNVMQVRTKTIALFSGGLDSILAARLMLEQGIEVEALNFLTVFCSRATESSTCQASKAAADMLGISLKVMEVSEDFFDVIKNPKHGYGRNLNPCLDCRIFMFKKAFEYMKQQGASFIVTGEVLGSRPMSQRRQAMEIIERESGLQGLIVRPLCAGLMKPTFAEEHGIVDREKLLSLSGRSRKPQIQLAKDFNINDYPNSAGGCLLTDKGFSCRMRDLMKHQPDFRRDDAALLKYGRHFRLSPTVKFIVGRSEKENNQLKRMAGLSDIIFETISVAGPVSLLRGEFDDSMIQLAAGIVARYSDSASHERVHVSYGTKDALRVHVVEANAAEQRNIEALRI